MVASGGDDLYAAQPGYLLYMRGSINRTVAGASLSRPLWRRLFTDPNPKVEVPYRTAPPDQRSLSDNPHLSD
jgi:hypothetical protein